jgi:hypothetical protein
MKTHQVADILFVLDDESGVPRFSHFVTRLILFIVGYLVATVELAPRLATQFSQLCHYIAIDTTV